MELIRHSQFEQNDDESELWHLKKKVTICRHFRCFDIELLFFTQFSFHKTLNIGLGNLINHVKDSFFQDFSLMIKWIVCSKFCYASKIEIPGINFDALYSNWVFNYCRQIMWCCKGDDLFHVLNFSVLRGIRKATIIHRSLCSIKN